MTAAFPDNGFPATENWRPSRHGGNITLWLDCACEGPNRVTRRVLDELGELLDVFATHMPDVVIVRASRAEGLADGMSPEDLCDLDSVAAQELAEGGAAVLDRLAGLPCATVAVMHGRTLGTGLSLALACDHRIGIDGMTCAFPEICLGLHPFMGGAVRLTRMMDPVEAMQMMLAGTPLSDARSKSLGLIDALVPECHVTEAVRAAVERRLDRTESLRTAAMRLGPSRRLSAGRLRSEAERVTPYAFYPAPCALIALWEEHGFDQGAMQLAETKSFARLAQSDVARNMSHVARLRAGLEVRNQDPIRSVHVIGADRNGAAIAAWIAAHGVRVTLEDPSLERLALGVRRTARLCDEAGCPEAERRAALDRLIPDAEGHGRARADLVIVAGDDNIAERLALHKDLADGMARGALLVNASPHLRLTELAGLTRTPSRLAAMRFSDDASGLVEIAAHRQTDPRTRDRLAAFVTGLGKLPLAVMDAPVGLVERLVAAYLMEAMVMIDEGHDKRDLDRAALGFGMPVGPVALADRMGLDRCLKLFNAVTDTSDSPVASIPAWLPEMVEDGHTGIEAGTGLYLYARGEKPPVLPVEPASPDISDRLVLPICDAAASAVRRKIVSDPNTVDAAAVLGVGFAPFRGGPLHYAKKRGRVPDRLRTLAARHGERFMPDAGWGGLA
ncbi:enoyl-CoA hydratase-related protein [Sagittula stellata]|uniref:Putative fatty acid oxidation complex alpha subunit n=1 Tax=Sagittula stellata (strain ATCC 700073 / DSM 11524 / E-37) TaxID=388399 RepID=A3K5J4_SAGS3|nr:enoyl-CoA hydratase-related protein [Sagittula stellata]EBA07383.1 putative fatty acid oxidation complex alpha subunit [Sagittula stellata E-37]